MEEEENYADAFDKFKAIEKKAIKAIFSSKVIEHKIEAAEIAILAKSYIKRFQADTGTFMELHEVGPSLPSCAPGGRGEEAFPGAPDAATPHRDGEHAGVPQRPGEGPGRLVPHGQDRQEESSVCGQVHGTCFLEVIYGISQGGQPKAERLRQRGAVSEAGAEGQGEGGGGGGGPGQDLGA